MKSYDITIVGGGLIGTILAIALKNTKWRIALVEAFTPSSHQQAEKDMRSLALSYDSKEFLSQLNLWNDIQSKATPIQKIHVSEEKRFGKTILDSEKLNLNTFGYVIPIPYLYQSLQNHLENIAIYRPATVTEIKKDLDQNNNQKWHLKINDELIETNLLIAADGDKSFIRETLNIPIEKIDYHQSAIVSSASISKPHENTAYQRFTKEGVLAIMPREDNRVGIIWSTENIDIKNNLLEKTQSTMGYRLGKFSDLGEIQTYPLKFLHATTQVKDNVALLGNAAHVVHPIAAQGLNLGLRDIKLLSELLKNSLDISSYESLREQDQASTENFTNNLLKFTKFKSFPFSLLRSLGLLTFDLIPSAKRNFCLKRMGLVA
jgi:2-octaprenyl-6-methoxyphenol hydroxylase